MLSLRPVALPWLASILGLALASPALSVPLPPTLAEALVIASAPGATPPDATDSDPVTAIASLTANGSDDAMGQAIATVDGPLRSQSTTSGASGSNGQSQATAQAKWTTTYEIGGIDPGAPVDVDLTIRVDGSLSFFENNSGVSLGQIFADMNLNVAPSTTSGPQPALFAGATRLLADGAGGATLLRTGGYASASRDGDFTSCGSQCIDVDTTLVLDDALLLGFGESFALTVSLTTSAFMIDGLEIDVDADFFSTGTVELTSDAPGVTFEVVHAPEPGLPLLAAAALAGLAIRRRRTL